LFGVVAAFVVAQKPDLRPTNYYQKQRSLPGMHNAHTQTSFEQKTCVTTLPMIMSFDNVLPELNYILEARTVQLCLKAFNVCSFLFLVRPSIL
jgi:hypothetical protein